MRGNTKAKSRSIMEFAKLKNEVLTAIRVMRFLKGDKNVNSSLRQFTAWGFYRGERPSAIDENNAAYVIDQLECYVNSLTKMQTTQLKNVYAIVSRHMYR